MHRLSFAAPDQTGARIAIIVRLSGGSDPVGRCIDVHEMRRTIGAIPISAPGH
jgi:hypothetical protein